MADIRSIDLNLLKVFDALMLERNVTRAAARLALTQPAVSGQLVKLREAWGDPLFVRASRGMVPTPRAMVLADPVRQVLADIGALLQPAAFDPATADFTVTLAATDYALHAVVVPFMQALREQAPGVRVRVVPVEPLGVARQLAVGDVDLALMTPDTVPSELHARPLFDETYVCAMRTGHPAWRAGRALSLERFCALDHALVSLGGDPFHGATDEALARLGRQRRIVLSVASFLVLPELLRTSDLVAVVPCRLMATQAGLVHRAPPLAVPGFTKTLVWHERLHRDPGQQWLRQLLVACCRTGR